MGRHRTMLYTVDLQDLPCRLKCAEFNMLRKSGCRKHRILGRERVEMAKSTRSSLKFANIGEHQRTAGHRCPFKHPCALPMAQFLHLSPKRSHLRPGPPRFEGRVKWFSKEKGFGKILSLQPNAGELGEEVFVHKSRFDGGPDGPHAQAVAEGSMVTFEIITSQVDGKPTACHVQVNFRFVPLTIMKIRLLISSLL
eukprot:symbB.v1.2.024952.t1/scaffold2321.1/size114172/11